MSSATHSYDLRSQSSCSCSSSCCSMSPPSPSFSSGRIFDYDNPTNPLSREQIAEIFSKPPYKRTDIEEENVVPNALEKFLSPSVTRPSRIRVRHLKDMPKRELTVLESPYGAGLFSKKAGKTKREHDATTGRNVAIVIFKFSDRNEYGYTEGVTRGLPGGVHSEFLALNEVPDDSLELITFLYTERFPCTSYSGSQRCHDRLSALLPEDTIVLASTDRPPQDPADRKASEEHFRYLQKRIQGIRSPSIRPGTCRGPKRDSTVLDTPSFAAPAAREAATFIPFPDDEIEKEFLKEERKRQEKVKQRRLEQL